jgi:hypothetical protein
MQNGSLVRCPAPLEIRWKEGKERTYQILCGGQVAAGGRAREGGDSGSLVAAVVLRR